LEKHHRLYLNVLAILDALRPHVFHVRVSCVVCAIQSTNHGPNVRLYSIIF
jgi:hypothetical protein